MTLHKRSMGHRTLIGIFAAGRAGRPPIQRNFIFFLPCASLSILECSIELMNIMRELDLIICI